MLKHTHTHTHTRTHAHTHIHTLVHTQAHAQTCTQEFSECTHTVVVLVHAANMNIRRASGSVRNCQLKMKLVVKLHMACSITIQVNYHESM